METIKRIYRILLLGVFLCFVSSEWYELYAQSEADTVQRELPQAMQRRLRMKQRHLKTSDSLRNDSIKEENQPQEVEPVVERDSIAEQNAEAMSVLVQPVHSDTLLKEIPAMEEPLAEGSFEKKRFIPDPAKATWLAVVFPGGGQIYNRKYWKLPIIYGGFVGCAYALTWNGQMYSDYSQAYLDIMDDSPETDSYLDLLPPGYNVDANMEYLKKVIKRKKDSYRRYRDLSIFCFIGVYIVSIIDAYVDAELASFDISKDLTLKMEPAIINNERNLKEGNSYGLQCSLRF